MGQGPSEISAQVVAVRNMVSVHVLRDTKAEILKTPGVNKCDFALCASGGGARALTFTMGVYRALQELGVMDRLDGISSVSGGTWASSVYMFGREFEGKPIEAPELLGAATDPKNLTMAELQKSAPPMARGLTNNNSQGLFIKYVALLRDNKVWARLVADLVLKPFNLDDMDRTCVAIDEDEIQRIRTNNTGYDEVKFHTPRPDRPKLFVMNGALLAPTYHNNTVNTVTSFQMSPDFCGCPFKFLPDVTYPPAPLCCAMPFWRTALTLAVGGGMVETFAFGGRAPSEEAQLGGGGKNGRVGVPAPAEPFSLAEMVGISSYAPAGALSTRVITSQWLSVRKFYWPISFAQAEREYSFGDGGAIDNSGLLPLLQRQAKKVIWIATSYRALSSTYDFQNATQETFDPLSANVIDQVFSMFGYGVDDEGEGFYYSNNQVFKRELLLPLCQKLAALKAAGKPGIIKESFEVLPNEYWGIVGGWQVELVLIYLEQVKDFEQQLPADTQAELAKGAEGGLKNYPIYETSNQNPGDTLGLTALQVNLLAAQAEYSVRQCAQTFKDFAWS